MNQCVPSWENNGISANQRLSRRRAQFNSNLFIPHVPSMNVMDDGHEVAAAAAAELMWENGELFLQDIAATGKTMPILFPSPPENNIRYEFEKPRAGGTLESVVNQGTRPVPVLHKIMAKDPMVENLFPWFYGHGGGPAANLTAMDALVPCSAGDQVPDSGKVHAGMFTDGYSAGVGSCSGKHDDNKKGTKRRRNESRLESSAARVPSSEWSDPYEWESGQISLDDTTTTSETERETGTWGFTSTSMTSGSPENTSTDEYDSPCQSRRPLQVELKRSRLEYSKKSSISTQRSMTAFSTTYNYQSEQRRRRRRDKMEERIVRLQKMVPNSNKVDKVAVLDEVIEHLKQLQSQVDMLNRMNMVAPGPMHQHQNQLQLQMMLNMMTMMSAAAAAAAPTGFMGMGMGGGGGIGMGVGLDPNAFTRYNSSNSVPTRNGPPAFMNGVPAPSPVDFINMTTSPFLMHTDPISMFLANYHQSQQQLTTIDGYGTMASFFNQPQPPQLKRPCG